MEHNPKYVDRSQNVIFGTVTDVKCNRWSYNY